MKRSKFVTNKHKKTTSLMIGSCIKYNEVFYKHRIDFEKELTAKCPEMASFKHQDPKTGIIENFYDNDTYWVKWDNDTYAQVEKKFVEAV